MTTDMTISQALRHIKKVKGQLAESLLRAQGSVSFKEKAPPAFQFQASLERAQELRRELVELEARVAVTNATTRVPHNGQEITISRAVRTLQELKGHIAWLRGLVIRPHAASSEEEIEYRGTAGNATIQVPWICALPEADKAAFVEKAQDEFDRLNDTVEKANHATALVRQA